MPNAYDSKKVSSDPTMIFEFEALCRQIKHMQETQSQDSQQLNRTLNGQRIVLIGGTSGFGFATAKAAAREGASVIVASSSRAKVDKAVAQLPPGTEGRVLDITREASVEEFFLTIGEFDHLAVTAGESLKLWEFATIDRDAFLRDPALHD